MNATRTGPSASVTYQFEIGSDAGFNGVVAAGTVPEGAGQTSFTPGSDLMSRATYFWRARATDTEHGIESGYSATQGFTTVNPDDGTVPYRLVIRANPWCVSHHAGTWDRWAYADWSFDSSLVVDGDIMHFRLPAPPGFRPFDFDIQRTRDHVTGRISGTTTGLSVLVAFNSERLSGQADGRGRFDGTFDGSIGVDTPNLQTGGCYASGFAWTLLPR